MIYMKKRAALLDIINKPLQIHLIKWKLIVVFYFFLFFVRIFGHELQSDFIKNGFVCVNEEIEKIMIKNRDALNSVDNWINASTMANSVMGYGLPYQHLINLNIGFEPTYSDLILYLAKYLSKKVNYLEIGVSIGKNFYQILHGLNNASTIMGIDIEIINPVLEKLIDSPPVTKNWKGFQNVSNPLSVKQFIEIMRPIKLNYPFLKNNILKKPHSSECFMSSYFKENGPTIMYSTMDVFDESSWQKLSPNHKFNLIFSDACHCPEGILYELAMLTKYDLIDSEEFVIIYDDLNFPRMKPAFYKILDLLEKRYGKASCIFYKELKCRGWVGIHEDFHDIGIILKSATSNKNELE